MPTSLTKGPELLQKLLGIKKLIKQPHTESFFSMRCFSMYVQPSGPILQVHRRVQTLHACCASPRLSANCSRQV